MPPLAATVVFAFGILGLFLLDRDRKAQTSKALWIPVAWLLINGSRPVSQWLQSGPLIESPDQYLDGSPLDAVVFAVLLGASLIVLGGRRRQVGMLLRRNAPILLFFSYCALSVLWSDYPFVALKRWTKVVGDLSMVLIVLTDPNRPVAIKRLLARTGFLLLPISILLIKYYPALGRGYDQWTGTARYVGVTTNKNLLGMICLIFGLGCLWNFLAAYRGREVTRRPLIAQGILLAMVLWLLSIANSMTSLSCFALAGSLMVLTSFSAVTRRPAVIHILSGVMLCIACSALFSGIGSGTMEMMGRDPTLTGRTEIWHLVLGLADNPLFGTGFESFWLGKRLDKVWDIYYFHLNEAHNGYIEVYLNLGWLGIAALALVMVTAYRDIVNSFRYNPDAARLRLTFLITAAAYSLTEAGFRMMNPVWISFLLAAIAVPEARVSLGATRSHTRTLQICEPSAVPVLAQEVAESVPRGLDLNHSLL